MLSEESAAEIREAVADPREDKCEEEDKRSVIGNIAQTNERGKAEQHVYHHNGKDCGIAEFYLIL